jgi:hypothetical protein
LLAKEPIESYLYRNYTNFLSSWLYLLGIALFMWTCLAAIFASGMRDIKQDNQFKSEIEVHIFWGIQDYDKSGLSKLDPKQIGDVEFGPWIDLNE